MGAGMNLERRISKVEARQPPKPRMTTEQRRRRLNELCAKAGMAPAEMQALTAKHRSVRAAIASICSRRDDDDLDIE